MHPQPSWPNAAEDVVDVVSTLWSMNSPPVFGLNPNITVGIAALYTCGTVRSGMACDSANATASLISQPGWCVPIETGLPISGFTIVFSG